MKYGLRIPSFALGPRTAMLDEMGAYLRRAEDLKFEAAVTHRPSPPHTAGRMRRRGSSRCRCCPRWPA
jgi:hypothetical protein